MGGQDVGEGGVWLERVGQLGHWRWGVACLVAGLGDGDGFESEQASCRGCRAPGRDGEEEGREDWRRGRVEPLAEEEAYYGRERGRLRGWDLSRKSSMQS